MVLKRISEERISVTQFNQGCEIRNAASFVRILLLQFVHGLLLDIRYFSI